jgi:selenocysteine lyase/cysteine desulfurase
MDACRDHPPSLSALVERFRAGIGGADCVRRLREGLIGEGQPLDGPFGQKPLVYADYVASGRALRQIEDFVLENVLPFYANSHTEASFCGGHMTRLRRAARAEIARLVGADEDCAVVFAGSGATAGINRLVSLLGVEASVRRGERPLIVIGPYEHHSNILPWRESGAEVVTVPEAANGGPNLDILRETLERTEGRALRIGAFSAASNVTGVVTDVDRVTALLKLHGALAVWDYAGGGPYLPMHMAPAPGLEKDAIVLSPHKFAGGPGASGVFVVRKSAVVASKPTWPGGGTVSFVSPWGHDYLEDLAAREEAGTPNVVGDIRAGLALLVKEAVGQGFIDRRHAELNARALAVWGAIRCSNCSAWRRRRACPSSRCGCTTARAASSTINCSRACSATASASRRGAAAHVPAPMPTICSILTRPPRRRSGAASAAARRSPSRAGCGSISASCLTTPRRISSSVRWTRWREILRRPRRPMSPTLPPHASGRGPPPEPAA